jgi:hypothetical protein
MGSAPIVGSGHGDDIDGWRSLKAAGISHMLVFGDAHGTTGYRAAAEAGIRLLWANPNRSIAPVDTAWCDYTLIADGDIAAAVENLIIRRKWHGNHGNDPARGGITRAMRLLRR